jgi:hypothetical protein
MWRRRFFLFYAPLLLLELSLLACGSSVSQLESISINPETATAQKSTSGEVQFIATGVYTDGHTVSPLPVFWGFHAPWIETPDPGGVSVNSNGLAQCTTYKGTISIVAIAPKNPNLPLSIMTITTPVVNATAHLTCQ